MTDLMITVHYPNGNVGKISLENGDSIPLSLLEGATAATVEFEAG